MCLLEYDYENTGIVTANKQYFNNPACKNRANNGWELREIFV